MHQVVVVIDYSLLAERSDFKPLFLSSVWRVACGVWRQQQQQQQRKEAATRRRENVIESNNDNKKDGRTEGRWNGQGRACGWPLPASMGLGFQLGLVAVDAARGV